MSPDDLKQLQALLAASKTGWLPPNLLGTQLAVQSSFPSGVAIGPAMPLVGANPNRVLLWIRSGVSGRWVSDATLAAGLVATFNAESTFELLLTTCWHGVLPQLGWWSMNNVGGSCECIEVIWRPGTP